MPFHEEALIFIKHTETDDESLLPIEVVRKGYFVKTYNHGYKKVKYVLKEFVEPGITLMQKNNDIYHPFIVDEKQTILVENMNSHIDASLKESSPEKTLDDMVLLNAEVVEKLEKINDENVEKLITIVLEGDNDSYGIITPDLICETFSQSKLETMNIPEELKNIEDEIDITGLNI